MILSILTTFLVLQTPSAAAPAAAPAPPETRDVRIEAGDVTLAGTLYRPANATGDLPAVVIAHGSAPSTRKMVGFYTNLGLRLGMAVLAFDKRGTGESTGKYIQFSVESSEKVFGDLAADIEHAVRWLATQPGVDAARIGLLGGSQAGWIMPLAASREPRVRFIVAGAGVPLSAGQEDAHESFLNVVRPHDPGLLPARLVAAADVLVADYTGPAGFNPAAILESLSIPTLWIFGLFDDVIPAMPSIRRIGELQAAGKKNHFIHVLPFADHNFTNVFTKERYDLTVPAAQWLDGQGIVPARKPRS